MGIQKSKIILLSVTLAATMLMLGACKKDSEVDDENVTISETGQTENTSEESETQQNQETNRPEGDGGGNEYYNGSNQNPTEIAILVNEDDYFYNNSPIGLDEIINRIQDTDGDVLVLISDNNATQNAYSKLTDKLDELEIPYKEQ